MKPLLSLDKDEARVRVLALYRAWYRQIPIFFQYKDVNVPEKVLKARLKEEFLKNAHIKDVRVIDMKVIQVPFANTQYYFGLPTFINLVVHTRET